MKFNGDAAYYGLSWLGVEIFLEIIANLTPSRFISARVSLEWTTTKEVIRWIFQGGSN